MGSSGKSNKRIAQEYYNRSGEYSDVDSKSTPISDEDKEIVGGRNWGTRYFQSSNAFDINNALRTGADEGKSDEDALKAQFGSRWREQMKTVDAMDRNMRPVNKDFEVSRMAGSSWLDRVMEKANIPSDVRGRLRDACQGFVRNFRESDVKVLRDYLVGGTVHENGFASTTYNLSLSDSAFRSRPIRLDISVTRGTKGLFSPTGEESEFVLDRKAGYGIRDVYVKDGQLVIVGRT